MPYRAKIRRLRGEQAGARWDRALGEVVVAAEFVVAAWIGAVAVRVPPDDEPHPASTAAPIRAVAASLTAQ